MTALPNGLALESRGSTYSDISKTTLTAWDDIEDEMHREPSARVKLELTTLRLSASLLKVKRSIFRSVRDSYARF